MSNVRFQSVHAAARSAPGARSFTLPRAALLLAIASACACALPPLARAQAAPPVLPVFAAKLHGDAAIVTGGASMTVTTTNGAGSRHSALDWGSFSIGAGASVKFVQPSTDSTSINRVVTGHPSTLSGTLSSNGQLVLVNPAGIAVGAGAVVDTAAFTASTLGLSSSDAITGVARFTAAANAGLLQVDGQVRGRGGVVLIGRDVRVGSSGHIVAENGKVILAAGSSFEVTGPGLEGIRMTVQSGDQALNLGTLHGDAVGIFAHSLTHSGFISANAVTATGGQVVLEARGGAALGHGIVLAAASSTVPPPSAPDGAGGQLGLPQVREVLDLTTHFSDAFTRTVEPAVLDMQPDRKRAGDAIVVTDHACRS
jgi:filamentous hemagglutinin family protein